MAWEWVTSVGRYRDTGTGQFMSRDTVLSFVNESIAASESALGPLSQFAASGALSPADFSLLVREEIKQETIRQYLLGIGGRDQMTPSDWGSIGGSLKEQYGHLDDFVKQIADGTLSEEQIQARLKMYVNSSREAFERAHGKNAKRLGYSEESWTLGEAEHCDDCVALAAEGWQPVGHFKFMPGSGNTACLTNCKCEILYRNPDTNELY